MELKTATAGLEAGSGRTPEVQAGTNDWLRVESAATDAGEESWAGTNETVDFGAAWQAGMKLLDNPAIVRIQTER